GIRALLLRRVVRRDGKRAESDRERLAERHDAADDRKAEDAMARHGGVDRPRHLRDRAGRRPDGDGPVPGAAHHHGLEDSLAGDGHMPKPPLAGALRALGALEPALEALDPSAGVHELLLARVEGVALGADLDVQLRLGRADLERVPAGARHRRQHVIGMDTGLHRSPRIAAACLATAFPPETMTTVGPSAMSTFPARTAAAAAAPAGSQASFARVYRNRMPSAISSALTRTLSTRPRQIWSA